MCHIFAHSNYVYVPKDPPTQQTMKFQKKCITPNGDMLALNAKYSKMTFEEALLRASSDPVMIKIFKEYCYTLDILSIPNADQHFGSDGASFYSRTIELIDKDRIEINEAAIKLASTISKSNGIVNFVKEATFAPKRSSFIDLESIHNNHNYGLNNNYVRESNNNVFMTFSTDEFPLNLNTKLQLSLLPIYYSIPAVMTRKVPALMESILLQGRDFQFVKIIQYDVIGFHGNDEKSVADSRWTRFVKLIMAYDESYLSRMNLYMPGSIQTMPLRDQKTFLASNITPYFNDPEEQEFDELRQGRIFRRDAEQAMAPIVELNQHTELMPTLFKFGSEWDIEATVEGRPPRSVMNPVAENGQIYRFSTRREYLDYIMTNQAFSYQMSKLVDSTKLYTRMPLSMALEPSPFVFPDITADNDMTFFAKNSISLYNKKWDFVNEFGSASEKSGLDLLQGSVYPGVNENITLSMPSMHNIATLHDLATNCKFLDSLLVETTSSLEFRLPPQLIIKRFKELSMRKVVLIFKRPRQITDFDQENFSSYYATAPDYYGIEFVVPTDVIFSSYWQNILPKGASQISSDRIDATDVRILNIFLKELSILLGMCEYKRQTNKYFPEEISLEFTRSIIPSLISIYTRMASKCDKSVKEMIDNKLFILENLSTMADDYRFDIHLESTCNIQSSSLVSIRQATFTGGLMQYLTCFTYSPESIDGFFGELHCPIVPGLSRNVANTEHLLSFTNREIIDDSRYIASVAPRDDIFGLYYELGSDAYDHAVFINMYDTKNGKTRKIGDNYHRYSYQYYDYSDEDTAEKARLGHLKRVQYTAKIISRMREKVGKFEVPRGGQENVVPTFNIQYTPQKAYSKASIMSSVMACGSFEAVIKNSAMQSNTPTVEMESAGTVLNLKQIVKCIMQCFSGLSFINNLGISKNEAHLEAALLDINCDIHWSSFNLSTLYGHRRHTRSNIIPGRELYAANCYSDRAELAASLASLLFSGDTARSFVIKDAHIFGFQISHNHYQYMINEDIKNTIHHRQYFTTSVATLNDMPLSRTLTDFVITNLGTMLHNMSKVSTQDIMAVNEIVSQYKTLTLHNRREIGQPCIGVTEKIDISELRLDVDTLAIDSDMVMNMDDDDIVRYGYLNSLKLAETYVKVLYDMIEEEQLETFNKVKEHNLYYDYEELYNK